MINLHEIKQPIIIDESKEVSFKVLLDVFNLVNVKYQIDPLSYNIFVEKVDNTWINHGGTLPKRIKKFFKHYHNIKISNDLLGIIGDMLTNGILNSKIYAEVKNKIDWYDGDFGDSYSCFWGNRSGAKYLIEKHGGGGIVFYKKDKDYYENLGRCLFLPYYDSYVFFNFYGVRGSFYKNNLAFLAEILTNFFKKINENVYIKLVHLYNLDEVNQDLLYINKKSGILVSDYEEDIEHVFLNIEYECSNCSKQYFEQGKYLENHLICDDCVKNYFTCKMCGLETIDTQMLANDDCVCYDCYIKHVKTCSICKNEYLENYIKAINDEYICQNCFNKIYIECDNCQKIVKKEEIKKVYSWFHSFYCCDECAKEIAKLCPECGDYFKKDEEINGVCQTCDQKRRNQNVPKTN